MATLSDLRTTLAADLRDPANKTFTTSELDRLINQGIEAVGAVYPREFVASVAIVGGTYSYAVSGFVSTKLHGISRIDVYRPGGTLGGLLPHAIADDPNSGWEVHADTLFLPPSWSLPDSSTLRVFGYSGYVQLASSSSTTDLDVSGINAVLVFAQAEAFGRLMSDRAKYQQWKSDVNNTDVSIVQLATVLGQARNRWSEEKNRLRRLRK